MKELIIGGDKKITEGDYSSHIIEALNKTYVSQNRINSPQRYLPGKFTKRAPSIFKSPKVDWNPEREKFDG